MAQSVKHCVVDQDSTIIYCKTLSGGVAEFAVKDGGRGVILLTSTIDGENGIPSIAAVSLQACEGEVRAVGIQDVAKVPGINVEELCVAKGDVGLRE